MEDACQKFNIISNKHFINKPDDHPISKQWYALYKRKTKTGNEKIIPDQTLNLLKYFISSDTALEQLNNKFLRMVLCVSDEGSNNMKLFSQILENEDDTCKN